MLYSDIPSWKRSGVKRTRFLRRTIGVVKASEVLVHNAIASFTMHTPSKSAVIVFPKAQLEACFSACFAVDRPNGTVWLLAFQLC